MKKLTTIFAGLFLLFSASAFTPTDALVSANIKTVFQKDFISASNVKWQMVDELYVASFKSKNDYLTAVYNDNGELLAVARYIKYSQMPSNVISAMEKKYAGYAITQSVVEISGETTSYLINVQNEKHLFRIKADASGRLSVDSKTKKK